MAACPVLGFTVQLELAPGANVQALWDDFLALLAERGLECVEGGDEQDDDADAASPPLEYLVSSEAGQATELDRDAVRGWLGARAEISHFGVGPLVDFERDVQRR